MGHLTEIAMVQGQKRGLVIWVFRSPADLRSKRRESLGHG